MEQGLPPWGVCNLGHINLSRFVVKTGDPWEYRVDWNNLEKAVRLGVRFQDNLIDITPYFHEENEKLQKKERRIGMGTLGIAEMLIRLKLRYGSPESIEFLDDLYSQIACWAYDESMELARKRGAFEMFDADKYIQSGFMQRLIKKFPYLGEKIKEHGIRNVCLLTQAPTGTTGTMHATSTGIEPFYSYGWWRNSRLGRVREEIQVLKEWLMAHKLDGLSLDEVNLPDYFTNAMELTPKEHVDVQAVIQKWTDSSISKTTNAPANYTIEQTKELYEYAYRAGLKGLTIYRDSSRSEQVLELDKKEEPVAITGTATALPMEFTDEVNLEDSDDEDNEEEQEILYYRNRRSVEPGFTHKMKTPIGKMYITVNFGEDDRPIEVFVNMSKPGQETNAFTQGLGRLISTMLKYNIPPGDIVKQLRGIVGSAPFFHKEDYEEKGELVKSICDAVGKIIEHYNGDTFTDAVQKFLGGPKPERVKPPIVGPAKLKPDYSLDPLVSGMACPECGGNVIRTEGCQQCIECSWSKC